MVPVVFPDSTSLWLFGLAALALLAIPGPAVLYIVVQSAGQGRRVGLASVIGRSVVAFSGVKDAGGGYLVHLGVRKLPGRDPETPVERKREAVRRAFARGSIRNVLKPQTALFFLPFLPQFVAPDRGG